MSPELLSNIKSLGARVDQLKNTIETEEATKTAFVMPFIQTLGYDVFNPKEVVPEFTADLGIKKGEKVDFAIFHEGDPILIIECKNWKEKLVNHASQMFRYFHVTKTRFALLTNGIEYRFFSDLESPNKMDEKPFLEFDITKLKESTLNEIAKFHKSNFDVTKIVTNASALKYVKELKKELLSEYKDPSVDFVKLLANRVYDGRMTEKIVEQFSTFTEKAFNQMISEQVNDRLNQALNKEAEVQQDEEPNEPVEIPKIKTTEEEMEGFRIVIAICRRVVDASRIAHRDTQSYFGILLDDNNRKPICRLNLDGKKKYIHVFDSSKNESRHEISSISDIYNFENKILEALGGYIESEPI